MPNLLALGWHWFESCMSLKRVKKNTLRIMSPCPIVNLCQICLLYNYSFKSFELEEILKNLWYVIATPSIPFNAVSNGNREDFSVAY